MKNKIILTGETDFNDEQLRKIVDLEREPAKRAKPSPRVVEGRTSNIDYKESEEEIKRKRELENKLVQRKKEKKKLEFV